MRDGSLGFCLWIVEGQHFGCKPNMAVRKLFQPIFNTNVSPSETM